MARLRAVGCGHPAGTHARDRPVPGGSGKGGRDARWYRHVRPHPPTRVRALPLPPSPQPRRASGSGSRTGPADPPPIDGGRGGRGGRPRRIGADRGPTPRFRPEAAPAAVGWKLQRGTLRSGRRDCIGQTALVMSAIIPLRSLVRDGSAASTDEPPSRCRRSTRPAVAPCAGGMLGTPLPGPASFRSCTARRRDAPRADCGGDARAPGSWARRLTRRSRRVRATRGDRDAGDRPAARRCAPPPRPPPPPPRGRRGAVRSAPPRTRARRRRCETARG